MWLWESLSLATESTLVELVRCWVRSADQRRLDSSSLLCFHAMLVDQFFDQIRVAKSRDIDFGSSVGSTTDSDASDVEHALKEGLIQLHVAYVPMPYLGNRSAQPSAVQAGSHVRNGQFGASATHVPHDHDWDSNPNDRKQGNKREAERMVAEHRWRRNINGFFARHPRNLSSKGHRAVEHCPLYLVG